MQVQDCKNANDWRKLCYRRADEVKDKALEFTAKACEF